MLIPVTLFNETKIFVSIMFTVFNFTHRDFESIVKCYTVLTNRESRCFANFRKNTPKNTTKPENIPGLLHFFDIFVSAGSECCSQFQGLGQQHIFQTFYVT